MRDPDFTLSAGPVTASPRVLAALGSPIVYHYDPVFIERFRATERKLAQVFLTASDVLLMQGEAVLASSGRTRPGAAGDEGAQPRPGSLRQGDGLLAEAFGCRSARAGDRLQRRRRPGRRRALPRRQPRDRARHGRPFRDSPGDRLRRLGDRPDRARPGSADPGRLRLVSRRDRRSRPTPGSSTSASPAPRNASAAPPGCR